MNGIMDMMLVALDKGAIMPDRAHGMDAGLDLFTPVDFVVPAHGYAFVDTGVHIELPHLEDPYYVDGHIRSKSGLNRSHGITADGTIDEGYDGPIGVTLHNSSDKDYKFYRGQKVAQLVVEVILCPEPFLVDKVGGGERGSNGFGSTGR